MIHFLLAAGIVLPAAGQQALPVQSRYDMTLYGYVKLDASYDTQRTAAGNIMFFVLPESSGGRDREFNLTANESRIGLRLNLPAMNGFETTGQVEADFYGAGGTQNSPNLRLRLAFMDVKHGDWALRAGQDWETFIVFLPRIVNFSYLANAGALGLRRPQARLTHTAKLGETTTLTTRLAAARTIGQDIDGLGQDDGAAAGYPSGQAALILSTGSWTERPVLVAVSGHAGSEKVAEYEVGDAENPVAVPAADYDSWSVIGSLSLPLSRQLLLQGTIWAGENLDNYFGGIGQGVNKAGRTAIAAQGGWAQLVMNPMDTVNINLGYGLDSPDKDDLNSGDRSRNEMRFGSVFYNLTQAITLAAEYSWMTTSYLDGKDAENHRVQGAAIVSF